MFSSISSYLVISFVSFAGIGFIYFVLGLVSYKYPPKKINQLYGYRTERSMKSQKNWDFAQVFSGKEMVKHGLFFLGCFVVFAILPPINTLVLMAINIVLVLGSAFLLYFRTENALKEKFKED